MTKAPRLSSRNVSIEISLRQEKIAGKISAGKIFDLAKKFFEVIKLTAKTEMLNGEWYNANFDEELLRERIFVKDLCFDFNNTKLCDAEKRRELLKKILPNVDVTTIEILSPFIVDYGYNIFIGEGSFFNHNIYLMDCAKIQFGKKCFVGPNCGFYTAIHPFDVERRNAGFEIAKPISIGNNVWIGADVSILPGVTIGDNCVIGAKSLVSKDIPSNVLAFGNPCKVREQGLGIRKLRIKN
ncbi:MAG: sugar O-acetyltransferase [Selenomonadaceae bacterium]|nr:sugar O-acetyltransferase [Selenomonadaceae bacterium]